MPLSVALPAPRIEYQTIYAFPTLRVGDAVGSNITTNDTGIKSRPGRTIVSGDSLDGIVSTGGASRTAAIVGGRACYEIDGTWGTVLPLPDWSPSYDGATQAIGSLLDPAAPVAVLDLHMALPAAAHAGQAIDSTGLFFIPSGGSGVAFGPPGVSVTTPAGGFGIAINDDGGGQNQFTFIAYSTAAVLQRTALPVPDVTRWSSFRFIVRTALATADEATLSLEVNSAPVAAVTAMPFDDVTLFQPQALQALAYGWALAEWSRAPGGFIYASYMRFGRFTPDGQEVQGIR